MISFQWSDAACGAPWERVDESAPPHRVASTEIDAVFRAEHSARRPDWQQLLKLGCLRRSGPIAILDAQVFGSGLQGELRARTRATLLGQALKIEHQLDPVERDILHRLHGRNGEGDGEGDKPIRVTDLIEIFRDHQVDEPSVLAAARSLLRRRLVRIDSEGQPGEFAAYGRALLASGSTCPTAVG